MDEQKHSELLQRMTTMFPHIPQDTVQHYVEQNLENEEACIQQLDRFQASHSSSLKNTPLGNLEHIASQLENLNMAKSQDSNAYRLNMRSNGNRSISNAGIPYSQLSDVTPNFRPQTAPIQSGNYLGFRYFCVPYGSHPMYTSNNNMMYQPGVDNGLLLQVPIDGYARSNSPRSENINVGEALGVNSNSRSHSPNIPPRPMSSSYMFPPQINPLTFPLNDSCAPMTSTDAENPSRSRSPSIGSDSNQTLDHNFQLHINVEPNDNPVHEWLPAYSMTMSPTYPQLSPMPIHLLPGMQVPAHISPVYPSDRRTVDQIHSPPVWQPTSMPVISAPSLSYSPQFYVPVPSPSPVFLPNTDIEKYLSLQRQRLNSLRYEIEKNKILHDNFEKENQELQIKTDACQQRRLEVSTLKEEIDSLGKMCSILYEEVDRHIAGKARLGEINDDFYSCLNTGQQGPLIPPRPVRNKAKPNLEPPCKHERKSPPEEEEEEENKDSSKWKCPKCTFANHPAISVCEMCIEPRNVLNNVNYVEVQMS